MPKSDNLETLKRTLAKMARRSDRETPYAFAGRKAERAHFRRRTESLPPYDGGAGGTTLITGAPGAGKTALMAQAVEDFREARPGTVEVKVPSQSAVAPASGFERFLREVAHRLTGGADPSAPDRQVNLSVKAGPSIGIARGEVVETDSVGVLGNPATFEEIHAGVARRCGGRPRFGPASCLLVTMDEVQNLKAGTWPALVLSQAHLQSCLPIQVICAGLSDSEDSLADAGVSRLAAGHHLRLGRLSAKEASGSVVRAVSPLAKLGLDIGEDGKLLAECAARFAKESDGWPKHLHCHMQAMFSQLSAMQRPSLTQFDLEAAVEAGNSERRRYYDGRLQAGKTHDSIVVALHDEVSRRKVRRSATNGIICNAVNELRQADAGAAAAWERQYEGSTEACFKAMLHAGLVGLDAGGFCFVPIPSLRAHIDALVCPEEGGAPQEPAPAPDSA